MRAAMSTRADAAVPRSHFGRSMTRPLTAATWRLTAAMSPRPHDHEAPSLLPGHGAGQHAVRQPGVGVGRQDCAEGREPGPARAHEREVERASRDVAEDLAQRQQAIALVFLCLEGLDHGIGLAAPGLDPLRRALEQVRGPVTTGD